MAQSLVWGCVIAVFITACKPTKQSKSSTKRPKATAEQAGKLSERDELKFGAMFIDGCRERMKGNIEIAENLFKECLKINPQSAAVKFELTNIYRFGGQYDLAMKYAKDCAMAEPKNEWYQLVYIECLHHKQQYAQATAMYEQLVKNFPERSDFYEGLAAEYMYAGYYNKSLKVYEDLEKRFGVNEAFTLNKIKLLKQLHKYDEAETELKALIASDPKEIRYYSYLAEFYQERGLQDKAMETYRQALVIDPKDPMLHLAMADYYRRQNDKDNAFKEIKIAFESTDLDPEAKTKILESYFALSGQYPEYTQQAFELCEILLKVSPENAAGHAMYGDFLYRDKRLRDARDQYALATKYDKSQYAVWNQLMFIESELSDFNSLQGHSQEAMELFPNQPVPYFFYGLCCSQLKQYDKAIVALNDGLEFVYDNKALQIQFYANLGDAYNALKQYSNSDRAFEDALKVDPDNAYVLNNYSYYLSVRKEHLEKAEKLSRRSNELLQNNRSYMDTYGWILYQMGKYQEAEQWLSRAAKMGNNKSAVILEHYGDVLYKLNKVEEALKAWQDARDAGGNSEMLNKKISDKKLYE